MLSDVSSLTDIESSEDDNYLPAKKKVGRPRKEWQPKQVLKAPRLTQYSTATLYEEILNGKVDLDPEYQRDVVWSDAKQSGLIDSILRNFYIPPVIFAFTQTEDGEERRTCIDGKQRLTSIQRFMDGQIPFKDSRTNLKLWYKIQPGTDRVKRLLPAQYRKQFALKQISCVEYTDINEDSEREIFQRVQLGVALTPAERMQAIAGPWPQLVRDVINKMEDYRIGDTLDWSKTRGRDFQAVAAIIFILDKSSTTYPGVTQLERWLQRVTPPQKQFKKRVMDMFKIFRQLVLAPKFSSVFQKPTRVSPIEFVMIVVLIDAHHRDHTLAQLADAIRRMRKDVRSKHDDIRANTKVTKTMLAFMNSKWPKDLKKEPGERPALEECEKNGVAKPLETGKRKRGGESDYYESDDSEDDRPLKAKAKNAKAADEASAKPAPQAQSTAPASRSAVPLAAPKPELNAEIKSENITTSESRPVPRSERLAEIIKAKERLGQITVSINRVPTPPYTSGSSRQTPIPQVPVNSQNASVKEQASSIINNTNPPVYNSQMWPGTPVHHMGPPQGHGPSFPQQFPQQMFQGNVPPSGYGPTPQMMPPPSSHPNAPGPSGGIPHPEQRPNAYRSGPPTPNLAGVNSGGWPSPNGSNQSVHLSQRSMSMSSAPIPANRPSSRDGRFDQRPGPGSSGSRHESPRQPPTEPRSRGQGTPEMRMHQWHPGASDRDREVLGTQYGGINGRDRERERSFNSGWSNRNGR